MSKESQAAAHAAVFQADIDNDMRVFEEQVDELEEIVEKNRFNLIGHVIGMVVVQIYLNIIKRTLDEDI